MSRSRTIRPIALLVVAGLSAACGGTASPPLSPVAATASPGPSVTPAAATPAPTPAPTPRPATASPSGGPVVFESALYRYTLTAPAGTYNRNWTAATRPWDGQGRFDMAGPSVDRNSVDEGSLYLVGAAAPDGLAAFETAFAENGTRFHGCTAPADRQEVVVGDVPAVSFSQTCAGLSFVRVAMVRDGFGIGAWISGRPELKAAAAEHLLELLAGLEWRTG